MAAGATEGESAFPLPFSAPTSSCYCVAAGLMVSQVMTRSSVVLPQVGLADGLNVVSGQCNPGWVE